jgi:hypothetical protein
LNLGRRLLVVCTVSLTRVPGHSYWESESGLVTEIEEADENAMDDDDDDE